MLLSLIAAAVIVVVMGCGKRRGNAGPMPSEVVDAGDQWDAGEGAAAAPREDGGEMEQHVKLTNEKSMERLGLWLQGLDTLEQDGFKPLGSFREIVDGPRVEEQSRMWAGRFFSA